MMLFPKTPPQHSARYVARMQLLWISLALLILSLLYLIGWGLIAYPKREMRVKAYEFSPGCMAVPPSSSGLSPCTFVTERIVNMKVVWSTRISYDGKYNGTFWLTLQGGNGSAHEVRFEYGRSSLWQAANIGDDVKAKYWQGNIVGVSGYGYNEMTTDNPELAYTGWDGAVVVAILIAVICGGLIAVCTWGNRVEGDW